MPGFILAKKVVELTKGIDWSNYTGMILLNHGVFSFGNNAKQSYSRMIKIVSRAESYLKEHGSWKNFKKANAKKDLKSVALIRKKASDMLGSPVLALLNDSSEAVGFSKIKKAKKLVLSGTLTPDHVIRTKPFPWIIDSNISKSAQKFISNYNSYFVKFKKRGIKKLDNCPRWALWPGQGTICFGTSKRNCQIVFDINRHTMRAMQASMHLDNWKPISLKDLFDIEYWELEQAKLKKNNNDLGFQGKIAIITGAASGIGKACVKLFLENGCSVLGLDVNDKITKLFQNNISFKGLSCDLRNSNEIKKAVSKCVEEFGGIDILISNAGIFPPSQNIEKINDKKWMNDLDINLNTHHKILRECIPYLKLGIDPSVVFMGSRNVSAPGVGAGTYSVAKAGLVQMSRLSAIELSKHGIRVNTIHPDCVYDTNVWSSEVLKSRSKHYGLSVSEYKKRNLLETEVKSSDVAELVSFLAGNKSKKITGSQIPIDGGNDRVI